MSLFPKIGWISFEHWTVYFALQTERPSTPEAPFELLEVTKESAKFSWKPSKSDGGSPITGYIIEMRETWKSKYYDCGRTEGNVTEFLAKRLKDGEEYYFRVFAENAVGRSDFLEMNKPIKAETPKSKFFIKFDIVW